MFQLLLTVVVILCSVSSSSAANKVARLAKSHFAQHGVRLPTRKFMEAMRAAAVDISEASCRKSLVIIGMANEEALNHTVPLFLESLRRVQITSGQHAGQTLDGRLVLVAWSLEALAACSALQATYSHQCVRDAEHPSPKGSFGFHSHGFNVLGFAKIKYILNGLSAGHDVVFLDTDLLLLRDPLPYLLGQGGDMYGAMEKCMVVNASLHLHAREYVAGGRKAPPLNIGVLYFKATAGVTRCVYNWAWDMLNEAPFRPMIWDQDIYGKIMAKCALTHNLRWKALDPRVFQSACFPACGCTFTDAEMVPERFGNFSRGMPFIGDHECGPQHWGDWIVRHFPCSGSTKTKGEFMSNMLQGVLEGKPVQITRKW
ncbi:hypothetical protein Agub_g9167 [Astrephomene gubernaculifera]|uniref:Glycosyltransferase n=1 Tax=Astrephomene gubernaculifera TaxID=47775 RepID=A0AAD3DSS5_9CHLO|nr:hypothetical protein Agub_g9167 [Astrephomene gubernaculifera]